MMITNNFSRGESRKMTQLLDKVSCLMQELRIYLDPTVLTICTVPYMMLLNDNELSMNVGKRHVKVIFEAQRNNILPLRLLDVARI